jgi:hypothetical protein
VHGHLYEGVDESAAERLDARMAQGSQSAEGPDVVRRLGR